MADDIFLSQEEQDERAKKWLKDNVPALAIGISLGLAAIFGFNQYKANKLAKAEIASGLYSAALDKANESEVFDIDAQLSELKESHAASSYASKVSLLKAKQLSVNDLPAAVKELQWVVDNAPEAGLQHTARIRKAKIQVALGDYEAATKTATQTDAAGFESHYSEVLADISAKQGDFDKAREQYQSAIESLGNASAGYAQILTLKMDRLPGSEAAAEKEVEQASDVEPDKDVMKTDVEKAQAEDDESAAAPVSE